MADFSVRMLQNKFGVKLTFAFRCAIYADHLHRGTSYPILADAFGVHSQTVLKICRAKERGLYHDVFAEFHRLGLEQMWNQYVRDAELTQRINNAAYNHNFIPPDPKTAPQRDTGPGKYWLKNINGRTVVVDIQPFEAIKDKVDPIIEKRFHHGFWFWHVKFGAWSFDENPFESVAEALRYFAEYPPMWGPNES